MTGKDAIALSPVGIDSNFTPTERPNSENFRTPSSPATTFSRARRDLDDGELVRQCRAGETAAFGELVARYRGKAYSVVHAIVENDQDARDLAQEGFLRAWRAIDRFKGRSSFYTWLYRIMRNVAVDSVRRRRIYADGEFDDRIAVVCVGSGARTIPSAPPLPTKELQRKEIWRRVNEAIAQLPPIHREVIVMKEFECLHYNEIAEILHCSLGTVMSRIYYARKKLQILLRDMYENL